MELNVTFLFCIYFLFIYVYVIQLLGRYRVEEKIEIALQKHVEVFNLRIKEIWVSLNLFLN